MDFFKTFYSDPVLAGIASFCSIAGLVLSLFLLYLGYNVRKKLLHYSQTKKFNAQREFYHNVLTAYHDLISKNKILDAKLVGDIRAQILNYKSFTSLLTLADKWNIFWIQQHLGSDLAKINRQKLCLQIAYFISQYSRDKEEWF